MLHKVKAFYLTLVSLCPIPSEKLVIIGSVNAHHQFSVEPSHESMTSNFIEAFIKIDKIINLKNSSETFVGKMAANFCGLCQSTQPLAIF